MSYEKEAIADSASAIPSMPSPMMKEDRVIDPYENAGRLTRAQNKIGQPDNVNGQNAPVETKATEETVTLSPQVAALARKEQKFRQEQARLKADKESLAAERAEIAELKALKAKLDAKDFSGVENTIDYEAYTNYLLEKGMTTTPEQEALKKLTEKVDGVEKAQRDDVSKRFEAAVNERRKAVIALVDSNPEYSKLKKAGEKGRETVVQHILDTWEQDGTDLSPEQAAKEVQELLIENAKSWSSFLEEDQKAPEEEKKSLPPLKPAIKTLTNNMAATGDTKRPLKPLHNMSDQERYMEARRRAEERLQAKVK